MMNGGAVGIERRKSLKNLLSDRQINEDSSRAGDGPENIKDRFDYDPADSGRAHISKDKIIVK